MSFVSASTPAPLLPEQPDARTRLARAAVEAFATRGFHGTTTRDISTAAGMSPAALYVHHRSKEDLLFELSRVGHLRVLEMVRESIARSDDPHADTKLSSSRGLTQEREGRSLSAAHPSKR